jgi:hypothetical protein
MLAATFGFDVFGFLAARRPFHVASPELRRRQIARWKKSKLGFQRDLIRYYESLATLGLYSRGMEGYGSTGSENQARVITDPKSELDCEIAVIGSGPGGSITACLLAEAGRDVVLIEEGPYYALESCIPFSKVEMLQKYRNGGQTVALGKDKVAYVEGRCVGGGSEINSGLYHRTPPDILEVWRRDFQVEALAEDDLRPQFEANERDLSVSLLPGPAPAASLKLDEGAKRLGWRFMISAAGVVLGAALLFNYFSTRVAAVSSIAPTRYNTSPDLRPTFDAGVRYFSQLKRFSGQYLRGAGFRFKGQEPDSQVDAVVRHAVWDHRAADGWGSQALSALAT